MIGAEFEFRTRAAEALFEAGFQRASRLDLQLPDQQYVDAPDGTQTPYVVFGDVQAAERIHLTSVPYSTTLDDDSQLIRGKAQHIALGSDTALVVAQQYDPFDQRFSKKQRGEIAHGSFLPLAERLAVVARDIGISDDQELDLSGFSEAADVEVEAVWQAFNNENFVFPEVKRMGVFEPARDLARGILVGFAFATSGKQLFTNVMDSHSPALIDARDIDVSDLAQAEKQHAKAATDRVISWWKADALGNFALMRGFGTDRTVKQLASLSLRSDVPQMLVVRMEDSSVFPEKAFNLLEQNGNLTSQTQTGDHSVFDNVARAAAGALQTAAL